MTKKAISARKPRMGTQPTASRSRNHPQFFGLPTILSSTMKL